MDVQLPDGTLIRDVPDGMSKADLVAKLKSNGHDVSGLETPAPKSAMDQFMGEEGGKTGLRNFVGKDAVMGGVRGLAGIGATLQHALNPAEWGNAQADQERRAGIDGAIRATGADPSSTTFQLGKMGAEVAGTAGAGGAVGKIVGPALTKVAPVIGPRIANALASNGFTTGAPAAATKAGAAGDLALRSLGGSVAGGAQVGLADPDHAGTGALVGGLLPPAVKAVGLAGMAAGRKIGGALADAIPQEVKDLALRAKELGIDVPVDRIMNSKPMNALASSLNYVPLSGRAAVERNMEEQMNRHLSTLVGQDSPNMTMALRKASSDLGGKFETTLKGATVKVDEPMLNGMAEVESQANKELGKDGFHAIKSQIDEIMAKGANGQIDGQAAYNIKRALDRIADRNAPEAFHAIQLKKELMGALDRSLGPKEAAAFKTTREQYGNMLDLEKLAKNGAEGDISIARLANMKNIGNDKLQEAADIAAQFLKAREGAHGAAQRVGIGAVAAGAGHFIPGAAIPLAAGIGAGRATNSLLSSEFARNALVNPGANALGQFGEIAGPGALRAVPRLGSQYTDRR